jgi:glyceraldehyde-3-phosphate dehydrogenase/erythrose-4-phosphate dehydrogenase
VSDEPLVSIDYTGNPASSVVDLLSTFVIEDRMVKVMAWYDNEWGYAGGQLKLHKPLPCMILAHGSGGCFRPPHPLH